MATPDITYRPAAPADVDGILELREWLLPSYEYENREQLRAWWHWQFIDNPAGRGIVWIAESDGRIVGHDAVVPLRMQLNGRSFLAGLSMDTMCHPDYVRRGIFLNLARRAHADARARGLVCVLLLANSLSRGGFMKYLGGQHVANRPVWIHSSGHSSVRALMGHRWGGADLWASVALSGASRAASHTGHLVRAGRRISVERAADVGSWVEDLWSRIKLRDTVTTVRDSRYLLWRYGRVPFREYDILLARSARGCEGYAVHGCRQLNGLHTGVVYDIVATGPAVVRELACSIAGSNHGGSRNGVTLCRCLVPKSHAFALATAGFVPVPQYRDTPLGVIWLQEGEICEITPRRLKWFHQIGDSAWV